MRQTFTRSPLEKKILNSRILVKSLSLLLNSSHLRILVKSLLLTLNSPHLNLLRLSDPGGERYVHCALKFCRIVEVLSGLRTVPFLAQVEAERGCCSHVIHLNRHVEGTSSSSCTPDVPHLVQEQVSLVVLVAKILPSFGRGFEHLSVDVLDLVYRVFIHGSHHVPLHNILFAQMLQESEEDTMSTISSVT